MVQIANPVVPKGPSLEDLGPQPPGLSREGTGLFTDVLQETQPREPIFPRSVPSAQRDKEGTRDPGEIETSQISKVGQVLIQMGLTPQEVREVLESAGDGTGRLLLGKLKEGLRRFLPKDGAGREFDSRLHQAGIEVGGTATQRWIQDPKVKELLKAFLRTHSEAAKKEIKASLAALLREKGLSPQAVKSFLETLTVDSIRSSLNPKDPKEGRMGAGNSRDSLKIPVAFSTKLASKAVPRNGATALGEGKGPFYPKGEQREDTRIRGPFPPWMRDWTLEESFRGTGKDGGGIRGLWSRKQPTDPRTIKGSVPLRATALEGLEALFDTTKTLKSAAPHGILPPAGQNLPVQEPIPVVLDRMIWMIRNRRQQARIQLSPPELGRLDLRLMLEQGHLRAHLVVEHPWLKQAIESNLAHLRDELAGLGLVVEEFDVRAGRQEGRWAQDDGLWDPGENGGKTLGRKVLSEQDLPAGEVPRAAMWGMDGYQVNVRV